MLQYEQSTEANQRVTTIIPAIDSFKLLLTVLQIRSELKFWAVWYKAETSQGLDVLFCHVMSHPQTETQKLQMTT